MAYFTESVTLPELESRWRDVLELDALVEGKKVRAHGVFTCRNDDKEIFAATQFRSLIMRSGVHETSIGEFLRKHPDIVYRTFSTDHFEPEPILPWKGHNGMVNDYAIKPDLMFRRADGYYDIVDLKLALIDFSSLTKGKRRRRGFVNYVADGIQQLANYREYFAFEENSTYAQSKFGIIVNKPNLYLIVGSAETANQIEISEAMRQYHGTGIHVLDFDTLIASFLNGRSVTTTT